MISSRVVIHDQLGKVDDILDRKIVRALNAAARTAATVADAEAHTERGRTVSTFQVIPAHGTDNGFASGIKARNPLWRIYDKGTLGKRSAALKGRNRRKQSWEVVRRGGNPYTAQRGDTSGEGVPAANISTPARTAGRKALIAALRR